MGQITYESIVTKREEPYPIGVSVIAAPGSFLNQVRTKDMLTLPGSDLALVDLVCWGMKAAGIPMQVKTGASVY